MLLNKEQRINLRQLYENPNFPVLLEFLDLYRAEVEKMNTVGSNEFQTLQLSFQRDAQMGMIDEIKRLLEQEAGRTEVGNA